MARIPYLLIRNVDPQTYKRLRKLAKAHRKSLAETTSALLHQHFCQQTLDATADETMIAAARKAKIKVRRV